MALGPRDLTSLVMLAGWDATALQNFKLQDGTTYASIVATLGAGLAAVNSEIMADPLWSALVSYTDQPDLEYRVGVSNGYGAFTEYGRPDAQRADTEGHMLPILPYDRALGWTWKYLKKARISQIEADIADVIKDTRDKWRVQVLTRLLKRGDDTGVAKGLGTAGESPGFATDEGSTAVDFVPPAFGGTSFDNTHEHYVGIAGGAFTNAVFEDTKAELREHGHEPPYEFIAGPSDETTIRGLTATFEVDESLVAYGAMKDRALLSPGSSGFSGWYIGVNNDCAIRIVPGMPQYYGFGWKNYGPNSQRNPLRIRVEKNEPLSFLATAMTDPRAGNQTTPIQYLMTFLEFGVGIGGDRTNGTARYTNNATWADGTPT
jgi:hypothetical protein